MFIMVYSKPVLTSDIFTTEKFDKENKSPRIPSFVVYICGLSPSTDRGTIEKPTSYLLGPGTALSSLKSKTQTSCEETSLKSRTC